MSMGVYIEGMEMPMGGRILIVFPSGRVLEVSADSTQDIFREKQALPVPEHGRLIDADALVKQIEHDTPLSSVFEKTMRRYLRNAPTVIPAEESKT